MYSADLSLFVLDAGIRLVEQGRARLLYLSLSDYVQHGHAPGRAGGARLPPGARPRLARLAELGCVVAVTADHGMNDKALADGRPHVIFLEDMLNAAVRRRRGTGDLPDHRPVRAPSRRARLVRAGLSQERRAAGDIGAGGARVARHRRGADPRGGRRAIRVALRPRGRSRRDRRPQHGDRRERGRA